MSLADRYRHQLGDQPPPEPHPDDHTDFVAFAHTALLGALNREPTHHEQLTEAVSYASYRAWTAGVQWGAVHGRGDWDDAERAWSDWYEQEATRTEQDRF